MKRTLLVLILVWQLFPAAFGAEKQQRRMTAIEYIDTYKNLAIEAMQEYGIPASIKMAQALVESDSGNSPLALNANNHFGIKCKNTWKGGVIYHDDDQKDECFRSYRSAYDSFRDHSDFLSGSQRYRFLFDLNPTDYRSWARGLSQAGYATNPDYSNMLIRTIEQYGLQNLDLEVANSSGAGRKEPEQPTVTTRVTDNTRPKEQVENKNNTTPRRNETLPPPVTNRPGGSRGQNSGPVIVPPPKVIGGTTRPPRYSRPELPDADGSLDADYSYRPPYTSATSVTSRSPYPTTVTIPRPTVVAGNNRTQQTASTSRLPQTSNSRYPQNTVTRPQNTTTTVTTRPQTLSKPSYKPQQDDYEYESRPRRQISMINAPEPVRPSGTSEGVYGAPLGAPAGYYNGPKFDPAGMPSAGKKRGVPIYKNNGCLCVIASQGQTLESIASSLRIRKSKLMKYNEFDSEPTGITSGSIVYISPKTNVVRNGYMSHQVIKGETLNYVSQKYGIHVAKLAKVNGMPLTYQIKRGQRLKLQ